MNHCPSYLLSILPFQLFHRVDAQFFLHIVPHLQRDDLSVEAVHDGRNIEFSIPAGNFRDVRQKLSKRFFRPKILFQQVFLLLDFRIRLRNSVRNSAFMQISAFLHRSVHRTAACFDSFLLQSRMDPLHSVVVVVRMLLQDFFDLDQKKLPF